LSFYRKIKYFLVHTLNLTNKNALHAIENGWVKVNNKIITENVIIDEISEIKFKDVIVKEKIEFVYLKFYKPIGFQSSLSPKVEDSLFNYFKNYKGLSIAGRLDKQSEGLLLLSNDGKWVEKIINPKYIKQKEYFVELDKEITKEFILNFSLGVDIGFYKTLPCECKMINKTTINVVITEGKNKQIRRMCFKLGYNVVNLKRIRMDNYTLGFMKEGETIQFKLP
jgi:23S rRNA pseudouridine2604 synthase